MLKMFYSNGLGDTGSMVHHAWPYVAMCYIIVTALHSLAFFKQSSMTGSVHNTHLYFLKQSLSLINQQPINITI